MSATRLCLSTLFTAGGLLADRDGDGLPDALRARLIVDERARLPEHQAALDLAARLGFETLALSLPLAVADISAAASDAVPIFLGRPDTLPAACPAALRAALRGLRPTDGLVMVGLDTAPAVLVAGADDAGLVDAVRLVAAYFPALSGDSARGDTLAELREGVRILCGGEASSIIEALVTHGGEVVEARVRVSASQNASPQRLLLAGLALPYDLTIILEAADGSGSSTVRLGATVHTETGEIKPAAPAQAPPPPLCSLAGLFGPNGLSVDDDGDLLPETPRTHIALPDDLSPHEAAAAIDLAARLGLESLGLGLPLALQPGDAPVKPGHITIAIEPLGGSAARDLGAGEGDVRLLDGADGASTIRVTGGDADGRMRALRALSQLDAVVPSGERRASSDEIVQSLHRFLALAEPEAWASAAVAAVDELPSSSVAASPRPLSLSVMLSGVPAALREATRRRVAHMAEARTPGLTVEASVDSAEDTDPVLDEAYRLPWEVDELRTHVTGAALPALLALPRGSDDWLLDLRVSEPEGRRRQIKSEVLRQLRSAGLTAGDDQVRVLPAYNQGRAWLLEEIGPRLRARGVAAVTVRVQRFTPAYPSLELPIRWLQDLHPVDELLGTQLGLPHEAIRFEMVDAPHTYEVEAHGARGETILHATLDVMYGRRLYLAGIPEWGTVHPPTGCVRLVVGETLVVDTRIAPDPERIWDRVRTALLPRLRSHILATTGGAPRPEDQPFFGEVAVEAWLSEEDAVLGVSEERNSPLESLHEDLYFMLLDYCCAVTMTRGDTPYYPPWVRPRAEGTSPREPRRWMAPGRIVPFIHRGDGAAPRVRFTVKAATRAPALEWRRSGEVGTIPLVPALECTLRLVGLRWPAGDLESGPSARRMFLELEGPASACRHALKLMAAWAALRGATAAHRGDSLAGWAFSIGHRGADMHIDAAPAMPGGPAVQGSADSLAGDAFVPWDRVLGLADIEQALQTLLGLPGVVAYQAGHSARGRPCYAVEVTAPRGAGIWSRARLSAWKCTLLLNARHHANEPSSSSAVLRLAALLAQHEDWRPFLDRVNVVIIPCENPDGAALHYALQEEHPTWMHHAGRYNDAGLEFVSEYTNPNTRHAEALVLPALWHDWTPDIVCDDHGFPSHEWIQPFSGHSNPWFQSHWISQGLIYLILPRIDNPAYARHAQAAGEVRRRMVRILADDDSIRERNRRYADRYRTFLSDWLPDEFPAPFEDDILVHTFPYDPGNSEQAGASLAGLPGAYPGVTTLSLITEVADETAQGHYMALCAHTHLLANRALLEYLFAVNAPQAVRRERHALPGGATLLRAVRPRPTGTMADGLREHATSSE